MTQIVSWNVRGASSQRAKTVVSRIRAYRADVVLLTEVSPGSPVCDMLREDYPAQAWSRGDTKNRGSAILSRTELREEPVGDSLQARCVVASNETAAFVALYGPAWNGFQRHDAFWCAALEHIGHHAHRTMVVAGDLNIGHCPEDNEIGCTPAWKRYANPYYERLCALGLVDAWRRANGDNAREYDYYPVKRAGGPQPHGRRFEHAFVSTRVVPHVSHCAYDHDGRRESDHSALLLRLRW